METRREKRLLHSIVFGLGGQFISLIAPIIVMPAMLHYMGDARFGAWVTGLSIASLAVFLDFGIGNVLLTRISAASGRGDIVSARRDIASAYAVLLSVSLIGISVVCLFALSPLGALVVSPELLSVIFPVLVIFFIGMPGGIVYRILYAQQKIPRVSALQSLGAFSAVAACLTAISLSAPFWLVVTVHSGTSVSVMYLSTIWFFRRNPQLRPRLSDFPDVEARRMLGFGSQFFLLSILTSIGMNSDILIISQVAGTAEVANFTLPMRIGSVLGLLVVNLFMPLWSFNGEALARGDVAWVRRNTLLMSFGGCALVLASGLTLIALSDYIMALWVGRQFEHQRLVLGAMTATSSLIALTAPYNMILNAKGMARAQILPWLVFVVLSIAAKFAFVGEGRAWMAPALTFVFYGLIVMPSMILAALRALRASRPAQSDSV